jgi:hypothetical protein
LASKNARENPAGVTDRSRWRSVLARRDHLKVFGAIVGAVAVDVVDDLPPAELPAELVACDDAVPEIPATVPTVYVPPLAGELPRRGGP